MPDSLPDCLPRLSGAARVWLFPLDRTLGADEAEALRADVAAWLPSWASHGRPVQAEAAVLEGRVLAVGAVISEEDLNAGVSGCGIDAMERAVADALGRGGPDAGGVALAPALSVIYRDGDGAWVQVPRPAFRRLARSGGADGGTRVLDATAETVAALRERGVERPAAEAWHGRAFRLAA